MGKWFRECTGCYYQETGERYQSEAIQEANILIPHQEKYFAFNHFSSNRALSQDT